MRLLCRLFDCGFTQMRMKLQSRGRYFDPFIFLEDLLQVVMQNGEVA
jgi:hypothetical protein